MANIEDKGKTTTHDQSDLMGIKPFGHIGEGRSTEETKIVGKLKKKKADALRASGSTTESGEKANVGSMTKSIGNFVNR